jgi:GntR family transcriptional regulator, transcriptional repressor for pyruvate dehydrogenase complex
LRLFFPLTQKLFSLPTAMLLS